ncbi:hypothetical protein [Ramlibacter tataouinensis]|nr:hypothetical protein [Ramlibacter tataouinensis]
MFKRVRVETVLAYADDKCAYFCHSFFLGEQRHAEVWVKMKFKKASLTVRPADVIGPLAWTKPPHIDAWEHAIAASMAAASLAGQ